jgi:hypothetical protein
MRPVRTAPWFAALALVLAVLTGAVGTLKGVAEASVLPSLPATAEGAANLEKVASFLERKAVAQRLADYGLTPEAAKAKVAAMSDADLSRLASLAGRAPEGGSIAGALVLAGLVALLVVVILRVTDKEIIIR